MKKIKGGKTLRRDGYDVKHIADKDHLVKCPEHPCEICVTGEYKRIYNRKSRQIAKQDIEAQREDYECKQGLSDEECCRTVCVDECQGVCCRDDGTCYCCSTPDCCVEEGCCKTGDCCNSECDCEDDCCVK